MIRRDGRLKRTPIRKRRSKPRKGRVRSPEYLTWIHEQPCLVSGRLPVTAHHVRFFGSPKSDFRTLPLQAQYHMHGYGPLTIEHGKKQFEERYGIDIEASIVRLNAKYEEETGRKIQLDSKPTFAQ